MKNRSLLKDDALRAAIGLAFVFALVCAPAGLAQSAAPSAESPDAAKNQDAASPLSHDLSGVWMQYRDGDVPGTPGMNGVNEHFRPPLTPWGQDKFNSAAALQGAKAVAA